jgi:hypothetical protein
LVSINRLQNYFRFRAQKGRREVAVPGFKVFLDRAGCGVETNYAFPDAPDMGDLSAAQASFRAIFQDTVCPVSVTYLEEYAPGFSAVLRAAGWVEAARQPVMVCGARELVARPQIDGLSVTELSIDSPLADVKAAMDINAAGFAPDTSPATDDEAVAFCEEMGANRVFLARFEGRPVAAGMLSETADGITELLGISTTLADRRKGFAAALTAAVTLAAFDAGNELVVSRSANAAAEKLVAAVGYHPAGALVSYRLPEWVLG